MAQGFVTSTRSQSTQLTERETFLPLFGVCFSMFVQPPLHSARRVALTATPESALWLTLSLNCNYRIIHYIVTVIVQRRYGTDKNRPG